MPTHHRFADVAGRRVFYREAGSPDAPTVVLLHGYPTSSFMFRHLIPALASELHVIAPDHIGFGLSDAPDVDEFDYTFDALADVTAALLDGLGIEEYAIYVQDYGAPIGWRLALRDPSPVRAIISQNGNAYEEGFVEEFWRPIWDYAERPDAEREAALRPALDVEAIRWQYTHGVPDPSVVSPDTWTHDAALVGRPGNDLAQLALFRDYVSNVALYPALHEHLRTSRVPVLAVWGRSDEIFAPAGAEAFRQHAHEPEIHLLDGGHFLLESALEEVVPLVLRFLRTRL
ncbi:alpha/beta fold hydrolase [Desertihabitans aurantiacus]|uniref:alpha/beta fold hydrolase n=1 Tax=Desertihabitans aurantiacus TaxID=2282477 RepID=UPI000DF7CEF6|nr:alpha/beta hydrolase [Desertihabitans aurantiacus]